MREETGEEDTGDSRRARFSELSEKVRTRARKFIRLKMSAALRKHYDSEDVLQDALLTTSRVLLGNDEDFNEAQFYSCLKSIVEKRLKVLARFLRAKKRDPARESRLGVDGLQLPNLEGKTPSEEISTTEQAERLRKALARLSPRARDVITLVHLEKLRVSEAAKRLKKTSNATSVLLCQALAELRGILKRREE
jgi:RNA polymerase sigma factor (sigma-70 family)